MRVALAADQAAGFHLADLAGDQRLVPAHPPAHVLQAQPGVGADQFEQADIRRRQLQPLLAQADLQVRAQLLEHFQQGFRQVGIHGVGHGSDRGKWNVNPVDWINHIAYFS
ncbi:hypothetical protein D3C78_1686680 [compost metagenome]